MQSLNLYKLNQVLHTEAMHLYFNTQIQLISNGVNLQYCCQKFNKSQGIITKSWSELIAEDILSKELLKRCVHMNHG